MLRSVNVLVSFWRALLALGMPGIIMGGIILGIFTPTEAAAIAAVYAALLGLFVYRELGPKSAFRVVKDSLYRTASVLFIFVNAAVFSWLIAVERVPDLAVSWVLGVTHSPAMVLLILNIFLLIAGCLLDPTPILLITVPVLAPLDHEGRHRPGPLRRGDGPEFDDRSAHTACRAEPLHRVEHRGHLVLAGR